MQSDAKKRVGVLRGGEGLPAGRQGNHYLSSLQKGGEIITLISENLGDKYKTFDILVDKDGTWHLNGVPILPADLMHQVDVIWNVANPNLSNILNSLSIPHISTDNFSFALQNNQDFLKENMEDIDVQMPRQIISPKNAKEVHEKIPPPWIIRIFNEVKVVKTFNELAEAINYKNNVIVEEFIAGKIATVHSIPNFRGEEIYTFPLGNTFGVFSPEEKEKLSTLAKKLHKHIGAKHYLKSDFVLTPQGKIYLLQINGVPNFKKDSHLSQVCESVGAKMHHVVEHIIENV